LGWSLALRLLTFHITLLCLTLLSCPNPRAGMELGATTALYPLHRCKTIYLVLPTSPFILNCTTGKGGIQHKKNDRFTASSICAGQACPGHSQCRGGEGLRRVHVTWTVRCSAHSFGLEPSKILLFLFFFPQLNQPSRTGKVTAHRVLVSTDNTSSTDGAVLLLTNFTLA
jgi:hypothetical protein